MEIISGPTPDTWIASIYGPPGCGKSTLAAFANDPLFIDIEGGLKRINCNRTPRIKTYYEFIEAVEFVKTKENKTIIIDTLDALEEILIAKILEETNYGREQKHFVTSLADKKEFGFGAGSERLKANWSLVMKMLFDLKDDYGKNILCIAHETIEEIKNPSGDDYDRFTLNVHKKSVDLVISKMDAVFFADHEKYVQEMSGSKKGVNTGRRLIVTEAKAHCIAKNRFGLPTEIDFTGPENAAAFFRSIH